MNSEAISAIIAKHATLKTSKAKLEAMAAGTYVVHRSWGFGQIKEYDESDMKLVIDFKGKKSKAAKPDKPAKPARTGEAGKPAKVGAAALAKP